MSLTYREFPPHADLSTVIECYWQVDGTIGPRPAVERIVPDACPELLFHRADPFAREVSGRWVRQPRLFLAGTLSRPWRVRPGKRVDTIGLRFRPGAITRLLDIDMGAATDQEVPAAGFLDDVARTTLTNLRDVRSMRSVARRLDDWLRPRLAGPAPRGHDVTTLAVRLILRSRGRRRIEDMSAACGIPRRRLERLFARDLGIRPKLFARIVRLNVALARLDRAERQAAVSVAMDAGYFDQAHMARDFRVVAGRRPGASRQADGAMARNFTRPERILKWLAGE
jgi:AraC-like DNA-binding protein